MDEPVATQKDIDYLLELIRELQHRVAVLETLTGANK